MTATQPAALQRKFVLDDKPRCVLAHVSQARAILSGFDERDIWAMIADRHLLAWDIALVTDPTESRRELRILPDTIEFYRRTGGLRRHNFDSTWPHIVMKGFDKPFVFSPQVKLLLNCKDEHVTHLIDAGHLEQLKGTTYRRGPTGAACITKASLIAFLKSRLEGAC